MEKAPPARQCIRVSRSFGRPVETLDEMKQAVGSFVSRTGEKLRREGLAASVMMVFLTTDRFREDWYCNSVVTELPEPTDSTPLLLGRALRAIERIFRNGCRFKKAGVMVMGLVPAHEVQGDLFTHVDRERTARLMETLDRVNRRMGSGTLTFAAAGVKHASHNKRPGWHLRADHLSPRCTTDWNELAKI